MMKLNIILSSLLLTLTVSAVAQEINSSESRTSMNISEFRDALRLYDKEMYGKAGVAFENVRISGGTSDALAYSVLCDVRTSVPGYEGRMDSFIAEYPHSALIPQIRYYHALNLFAAHEYKAAAEVFAKLTEKSLYRNQRTEYTFRKAYCALENAEFQAASEGFAEVDKRPVTDYTAPSRYGLGYIEYRQKNFKKAISWFEKVVDDMRFKDMARYYIIECRFLLKDYEYVIEEGEKIFSNVPSDRKPHLARILSESYLVKGKTAEARKYHDISQIGGVETNTRADWFHSGSVLYAVEDYKGAIRSFSHMGEKRDSIGQAANYKLGYSYIKTKDKVSAMNAFKEASEFGFDSAIEEDALFNYAKLAFDLNSDITGFNDYMAKYKSSGKAEQIYSYMAVAALYEHDFAGAVEAYDKIDELADGMKLNYMKANYLRAHQLIRNGSYRKAVPCLKAAAYYSEKNSRFNQLCRFWLAESYYRNDQYIPARDLFVDLYNVSALYGQMEAYLIPYNIAYCYFKEGKYALAKKWFGEYLSEKSVKFRKEALVRKADCDFAVKNYASAAASYDLVLRDYFNVNDIYPYYQSALSYGLSGNQDKKIELLANVLGASPDVEFYPEALYELGRTYTLKEDEENAKSCYERLVQSVKDSTFVAKAYIEMGTLARNQSMFNEALGYYKTVVEEMPLSEYADDALLAIESIYQTKEDPEEYIAYIERIGKGGIKSDEEKEDMIFNSAEQVFLSENYQKALVSLQNYLDKYPKGRNLCKAGFYMAESFRMLGKYEQACDCYKTVIEGGEGSFVELSILNFANLSYRLERWEDAYGAYVSLGENAKLENNIYVAHLGMMRSAYKAHAWENAVTASDNVLMDQRADNLVKTEASFIKSKSYLAMSRRDEAFAILETLSSDVSGSYGAEAAYMLVQDCYDRGEFEKVEERVYAFADAGSGQTYWLARCFIVLGDSFMERDDVEQAKATFESIRDGYTPAGGDDDVLDNVKMRLKRIEEMVVEQ